MIAHFPCLVPDCCDDMHLVRTYAEITAEGRLDSLLVFACDHGHELRDRTTRSIDLEVQVLTRGHRS